MILRDLRSKFKKTMPISDGFFKLMKQTFGFYTSLCNEFFTNLGSHVEANTLSHYLQSEIRPKLFDPKYCKDIETVKKQFLAENIKLEQFLGENDFDQDFINDFNLLRKVSDAIYELLQTHWEFFKYEKSVASNEAIIAFILEIDRIGIRWDAYLEKYLAISGLLKAVAGEAQKTDYSALGVQYHLPENTQFTLDLCTTLIEFLKACYEFVLKVHDKSEDSSELEITNLMAGNPVNCELLVPTPFVESFSKFLGYLSVDVLKRETLVKFVMEIVRLQQGKEIPKTAIANFQKKISKHLNQLHPEGYFTINNEDSEDSVQLISALCNELDQFKVEYKDMLTGSTNRMARNRNKPLSQLSPIAKKIDPVGEAEEDGAILVPPGPSAKSENKSVPEEPQPESTVKIDVKNKEHIQYLTS